MEKSGSKINWLAINGDLISCLKNKGNHRLSRFDAFIWLIEHIQTGTCLHDNDTGNTLKRIPFSASYKLLAEQWNWERHSVHYFIEELIDLSVISTRRKGNLFEFSLCNDSLKRIVL